MVRRFIYFHRLRDPAELTEREINADGENGCNDLFTIRCPDNLAKIANFAAKDVVIQEQQGGEGLVLRRALTLSSIARWVTLLERPASAVSRSLAFSKRKGRYMFDQEVLTALRGWAQNVIGSLDSHCRLTGIYVFGSLINAQGIAFSKSTSDIDLLIIADTDDPARRTAALHALAPLADTLDSLLYKSTGRSDKELILSTTFATKFEVDQGIHKDRNSRIFFASPSFLSLTEPGETLSQVGNVLADDLVTDCFPAWTVMANAQAQRNKYLRRGRGIQKFDSIAFVLPKDLLRNAYAVACLVENRLPRYNLEDDIAKGLTFIRSELAKRSEYVSEAAILLSLVESNRPGGKGDLLPVEADLIIYAWEMLSACAQSATLLQRSRRALRKNRYAASNVAEELERFGVSTLLCVDGAVELYRGDDLVLGPVVNIRTTHRYLPDVHEIVRLDNNQLSLLAAEWPPQIQEHLKSRFGQEGSDRSECKVGFVRFDYSQRGLNEPTVLSVRPLTYWVTRQFNKEIALRNDAYHSAMRTECAERLFCGGEDMKCECPSALYLELAVITSDTRVPVLLKAARQSVVSVRAGSDIRTCGPEFGFIWAKHVQIRRGSDKLRVEKAIYDGLEDEFRITNDEIEAWHINSLAVQAIHLNSALLGVVRIKLSQVELTQRLRDLRYHSKVETFLAPEQLYDRVQSDFGKQRWHPTGLLRLTLAAEYLGVVPSHEQQ